MLPKLQCRPETVLKIETEKENTNPDERRSRAPTDQRGRQTPRPRARYVKKSGDARSGTVRWRGPPDRLPSLLRPDPAKKRHPALIEALWQSIHAGETDRCDPPAERRSFQESGRREAQKTA